jgi:hypothetical protein
MCGVDDPYMYSNATANAPMMVKGVSMYGTPDKRQ